MVGDYIIRNRSNCCSSFFSVFFASPVLYKMRTRKNVCGIVKVDPVLLYVPLILRSVPFKIHFVRSHCLYHNATPMCDQIQELKN